MGGDKMKFYTLYCGYDQEDIKQMMEELRNKQSTFLMDNYIVKKVNNKSYIMEDKWETEPYKELHGNVEKIILDAISIECLNKKSRFQSLKDLTDYMVRQEKEDMEEYLRHEEEWEY